MTDCGKRYAKCACIRAAGHAGPCACDCGGITDGKDVWAYPVTQGIITRETVEARVASLPHKVTTAQAIDRMLAMWGFDSDDEGDGDGGE